MGRLPTGSVPIGSVPIGRSVPNADEPKADGPQAELDPLDPGQGLRGEAERRAPHEDAQAWTELHALLEAAAKRRHQEAAQALKHNRRRLIQPITHPRLTPCSPPAYPLPTA